MVCPKKYSENLKFTNFGHQFRDQNVYSKMHIPTAQFVGGNFNFLPLLTNQDMFKLFPVHTRTPNY